MNRIVQAQLNQISGAIDQLEIALKKTRDFAQKQEAARDDLQKQLWKSAKETTVLQHAQKDYEVLQAENDSLRTVQTEINERLNRVLGYTKALSESLQP